MRCVELRNQFGRRNLPVYERARLALLLEQMFQAKAKENQVIRKGEQAGATLENSPKLELESINTRVEIAKAAGVSDNTIARVKKIQEKAPESVKAKLRSGETTINKEYKAIVKPLSRTVTAVD